MSQQESHEAQDVTSRRFPRRAVLAGAALAGSAAAAYAVLGSPGVVIDNLGNPTPAAKGDTEAIRSESVQISHLLRRAGFGATPEEHQRYQSMGLEATIDELVNYGGVDDSAAEAAAAAITIDHSSRPELPIWWVTRMAMTKRPLQEKMTLFWHGLLTSQMTDVKDPVAMQIQNQFFRANALARFPDILKGVQKDRAMMVYLDIAGSSRRSPNENYSREMMELFALGVGNYTEQDVREAARAFTGWSVPRSRIDDVLYSLEEPVFRPQQFDSGQKTFLGRTGNFDGDDIVDIVTARPESARHIVRRLFRFFVHPNPTDAELEPFVVVYESSGMSIGAVVEAILRSDVFYSPAAYRAIVKGPIEYVVGAIKALDLQQNVGALLGGSAAFRRGGSSPLIALGQLPFEPPNVSGWPGGGVWLNSATMFARLNLMNTFTGGGATAATPQSRRNTQPSIGAPGSVAAFATGRELLDTLLPLALDDNLPLGAMDALTVYAGDLDTEIAPATKQGLAYLVLASPQFHLS